MEIDFLRGGENSLRITHPLAAYPILFLSPVRRLWAETRKTIPFGCKIAFQPSGYPWGHRPDLPLDLGEAFRSAYELTTGGRPILYQSGPCQNRHWSRKTQPG